MGNEFGSLLEKLRTERGLKHRGLASLSKIHHSYISQIETGVRQTTLKKVLALADALRLAESEQVQLIYSFVRSTAPQEIKHLFEIDSFEKLKKDYIALNSRNKEKLRKYLFDLLGKQKT